MLNTLTPLDKVNTLLIPVLSKKTIMDYYTRHVHSSKQQTTAYLVPRLINDLPSKLIESITPINLKIKLINHFLNTIMT